MAYNNNRRGGGNYGRGQGSNYQNRGNYGGNRGGYSRGGGNSSYSRGNDGGNDFKYVRSSFFSKHLIFEGEDGRKEPAGIEPGVTEEMVVTLTPSKTQELMKKLQDAINDQQGDGGVRITMYAQHKINKETNEEFDGASILVVGKFPPKNNNGFQGKGGGGNGRRQYPERQAHTSGNSRMENRSEQQADINDNDVTPEYSENAGW